MASAFDYLLSFAALLVLAPLVALMGKRTGFKARAGMMLASMLLAFGEVLHPPVKHAAEAARPPRGSPESGEPPLPGADAGPLTPAPEAAAAESPERSVG